MKAKNISIKWKLIGYLLAFVGAVFVLLWLFQVVLLDSFYYSIKTKEMKAAADAIEKTVGEESFVEQIVYYAYEKNMCVSIIDQNGLEMFREDSLPTCTIHKLNQTQRQNLFEEVRRAGGSQVTVNQLWRPANDFDRLEKERKAEQELFVRLSNSPGMKEEMQEIKNMVYGQMIEVDGQEQLLMLNTTLTPIHSTQEILKIEVIYICIILAAFSVVLAYVIYRRISRPIIETTKQASRLAAGDYTMAFDQDEYREVGQLNQTLNYAAKELSKTESLRRELLSNVSHDLRTPLTLITGYAEVMRDIPGENTAENVQVIIDEGRRLSELVTDLLDLSKLQSGVTQLQMTRFSLTEQIQSMLQRYNKLQEQEGYVITFEAKENIFVKADELKISQVMYNLVNNAIHYTGENKQVNIIQSREGNRVKIEVLDTGSGVNEEDMPYIWDRYYKVDKEHQRGKVGTGLGLSIVKEILQLHQADFGVENRAEGGSNFWFSLVISNKDEEN